MRPQKKLTASEELNRHDQIYYVAAKIFCDKGYDATSMSDIADAVGITKAGIYHYVKSKQDLLFAIMNFAMDRLKSTSSRPRVPSRTPNTGCARSFTTTPC